MFPYDADEKLHATPWLGYDGPMSSAQDAAAARSGANAGFVRDPLGAHAATLAARQRSMSERLELALSWNAAAAELRAGLEAVKSQAQPDR
jgi:hypothetical protein